MNRTWRAGQVSGLSRCVCALLLIAIWNGECGAARAQEPRMVRVYVALADNEHQGIVQVPRALGNGEDAARNLYWGAAFGVRTFLKKNGEWKEIEVVEKPSASVLQRSIFVHRSSETYLVADAYRGKEIKTAIEDFFLAAAGEGGEIAEVKTKEDGKAVRLPAKASLLVYVGHDGLMDFAMDKTFPGKGAEKRAAMVLACASKVYFAEGLRPTGARPLLWTTGLMAPEAYTLEAAVEGWIAGETGEQIRERAAAAYAKYQRISLTATRRLFVSGW